ncbi:MAG: enoyl-CoA hydratase-related protein, partial [Pseudomonadota bacterium]|nr:enoyl-CoA hydratase-related protein [Pseudomonadota bacterium]
MRDNFETIQLERKGDHLLVVTLNRPKAGNSMNTLMGEELRDLWSGLYCDQEDVRCAVLTGSGDRIFCAGADLKERNGMTDAQWMAQHALFEQMIMALMDCPVPVIAAINGASYAGGFEMTLGCDFVYASKTARFALTEVTLGIMPGACGTQNLPRAVGVRRAKEIILTGEPISAEQAYEYGIVNKLCEPGSLLEDALATAQKICDNAPISIRQAKKSMSMSQNIDL